MKTLKIIILCTLVLCIIVGCTRKNKDNDYFNGDISYFKNRHNTTKNVNSKNVPVENYGYGMFAAHDSLAIFWNPKFPEHFFGIFNIDTGEEIGYFCNKGRGPKEMLGTDPIFQLFKKGDDLMSLQYAEKEGKIYFWNISQSVATGTTVYDTIIPFDDRIVSVNKSSRIDYFFYQGEDRLLAKVASIAMREDETKTPYYEQRTIGSNDLVRDFRIYKKESMKNKISEILPADFFYSIDAVKPDGSKIVQAMRLIPQINIIDLNTGEVIGCRLQDGPDFSFFETKMRNYNINYISVQADNSHIYATFWGEKQWQATKESELPLFNTIHVFDWSGKHLYELKTDRSFLRISLDQVRNRLYTADPETEKIYYLELDELDAF